ncbi:hypothetical protein [Nocardiopsis quinghaiensis]|uniref:hypothetical protein n=1 Tax=Nocardiopsis quinghaiensis TaxID=464995 RepID=UPI00123AD665|nr:hypothetical protein [Nocardiopsis quinghaiensis]
MSVPLKNFYVALSAGSALVLVAALAFIMSDRFEFNHAILDASEEGGGVVRSVLDVQEVRRLFEEDSGEEVISVEPAKGGAVLVLEHGVVSVGIDPFKERWFYRGEDLLAETLMTPNGEKAVLFFGAEEAHEDALRVVVIDTLSGNVESSYDAQETGNREFGLSNRARLVLSGEGIVEARSLLGDESLWSFDPAGDCTGGKAEEVQIESINDTVSIFSTCLGEGRVSVSGIDSASGNVLWGYGWDGTELPRTFSFSAMTVAGGEDDPIRAIVGNEFDGQYSLISGRTGRSGSAIFWTAGDSLEGYIQAPNDTNGVTPENVVIFDSEQELNARLILQTAHRLYEEGEIARQELDEEVLLVGGDDKEGGRLPMTPDGWAGGANAKISALHDIIVEST